MSGFPFKKVLYLVIFNMIETILCPNYVYSIVNDFRGSSRYYIVYPEDY